MNQPVTTAKAPYPHYLAWSITVSVIAFCVCCVIGAAPGIVAIVYGSQVGSKYAAGDEEGARRASENAKLWCWIGTALAGLGLLLQILSFFVQGMGMLSPEFMQQLQNAR